MDEMEIPLEAVIQSFNRKEKRRKLDMEHLINK